MEGLAARPALPGRAEFKAELGAVAVDRYPLSGAYRANAPVIDQLLNEAGFPNHSSPLATLLGGATGTCRA